MCGDVRGLGLTVEKEVYKKKGSAAKIPCFHWAITEENKLMLA